VARAIVFLTAVTFVATGLASEAWAGKKAVKGEHIQEGLITTRKAGGDPQFSGKASGGNPKGSVGSRAREPGKLEMPNIK
jgi:hypothetical protein